MSILDSNLKKSKSKPPIYNSLIDLFPLDGLTSLQSLLFTGIIVVYFTIIWRLLRHSCQVIVIISAILCAEYALDVIEESLCSETGPKTLPKFFNFNLKQFRLHDKDAICTMLHYKRVVSLRYVLDFLWEFCSGFDFENFIESKFKGD